MATWTGLYIGANAGWGWPKFSSTETPFGTAAVDDITPQSLSSNTNGPIFGAQVGYNRIFNTTVLGLEADLDGAGIQGNAQSSSVSLQSLGQVPNGTSNNGYTVQKTTALINMVMWLVFATNG
jgi:hypothetical protein